MILCNFPGGGKLSAEFMKFIDFVWEYSKKRSRSQHIEFGT